MANFFCYAPAAQHDSYNHNNDDRYDYDDDFYDDNHTAVGDNVNNYSHNNKREFRSKLKFTNK